MSTTKTTAADAERQLVRCELVNAPAHDGVHGRKRNCRNPQPEIVPDAEPVLDADTDAGNAARDAALAAEIDSGEPMPVVDEPTDEQLVDAALGVEPIEPPAVPDAETERGDQLDADAAETGDAPAAAAAVARRGTRARKSAAKTTEPTEPTPVDVSIHIGADGNYKVHKPGCRDIARELKDPHVDAASAHIAQYASVEQIVRGEWRDQIGDNWDYATGEPSLEYLAEHMFVGSVDVLPCIASKLVALPDAAPRQRRQRAPQPDGEPTHRADLGALDSIAGYVVVKSTPAFDQLKRSDLGGDPSKNLLGDDDAAAKYAARAEWLTRCNYHGKTTVAANRKHGRGLGASGARAEWCAGCKRVAKRAADAADKAAAAADATAEHDAAVASS